MSSSLCWVCEKTFIYDFPGACKQAGTFSGIHFWVYISCGTFSDQWAQHYCTWPSGQWIFSFCFRTRLVSLPACSKGFINFKSIPTASAMGWEIFSGYYEHVRTNIYLCITYYCILKPTSFIRLSVQIAVFLLLGTVKNIISSLFIAKSNK